MIVIKAVLLCVITYLVCFFAGELIYQGKRAPFGMKSATGLMIVWALFYVIAIPIILLQPDTMGFTVKLKEAEIYSSNTLTKVYSGALIVLVLSGVIVGIVGLVKSLKEGNRIRTGILTDRNEIILLGVFLALVFFQLFKSVFYAYSDGDDSYYVSVAQIMASGENTMYMKDPYNGYPSDLQIRYALAPFPIWVGYLGRIFELNAGVVAHTCMPVMMIPLTYIIYNSLGELIFENNKLKKYAFLCLLAVFVMFSHYSYMPAEVFLLTRSRQGKEALANIVIPLLFYKMFEIVKEEDFNIGIKDYIMIIFISLSAALTSVFGNVLVLVLLFALLIYSFYKRSRIIDKILICSLSLPPFAVMALYYLK